MIRSPEEWKAIRTQGLGRYLLVHGVLQFGLPIGTLAGLYEGGLAPWLAGGALPTGADVVREFATNLAVFGVFGLALSGWFWFLNERIHHNGPKTAAALPRVLGVTALVLAVAALALYAATPAGAAVCLLAAVLLVLSGIEVRNARRGEAL